MWLYYKLLAKDNYITEIYWLYGICYWTGRQIILPTSYQEVLYPLTQQNTSSILFPHSQPKLIAIQYATKSGRVLSGKPVVFSIPIDFCIEFWNSTFSPVLEYTEGIFLTISARAFQWWKPQMRSCFRYKVIQVFLAANSTWTYYNYCRKKKCLPTQLYDLYWSVWSSTEYLVKDI